MLQGLLLSLNILVCLALIGVVLLQRSEGGALGGGSPTGLITTRGAGDLLTRTTWILFGLFLTISLALTLIGGRERSSQAIIDRLKLQSVNPASLATPPPAPAQGATGASTTPGAPPAVQLPPLGSSPAAAPVPRHAMAIHGASAPAGPAPTTSPGLSLPPLTGSPASEPAKPPTP